MKNKSELHYKSQQLLDPFLHHLSQNTLAGDCSPAYPPVCKLPPPPDLDCKEISFRHFQGLPLDQHQFDGDDCES